MGSRIRWTTVFLGIALLSIAAVGGLQRRMSREAQAQSAAVAGAPAGTEPSIGETVTAMRGSIASLRDQLSQLDAQLQALETRIAANAPAAWRPAPNEFVAIYRAQADAGRFGRGGASIARFTVDGADIDKMRPIDGEVHHVAVDSVDGKVYGVGSHRIVEIDPETLKLKELPIAAPLPELSWPCGMTFDSARRRIIVASLGGEGCLYAFDTVARTWSLIASLDNLDLAGLAYSKEDDKLLGLEVGHEGGVRLHTFNPAGALIATRDLGGIVPAGELGQHDCQLAVVGRQGVIIGSSHYNGALGRAVVHDPKLIVFDLEPAPKGRLPRRRTATGSTPERRYAPVDLGNSANQRMDQPFQLPNMTGNNFADFPRGQQVFDGVTFEIRDACIQLAGELIPEKPERVDPIPLGERVTALHFLHATGWGEDREPTGPGFVPDGAQIAQYVVRYADGHLLEVPVVYGRDLRNWWKFQDDLPATEATVAWEGANETATEWGVSLRLYHMVWENPHPERTIESVAMERVNPSIAAPFCVAITAESDPASK